MAEGQTIIKKCVSQSVFLQFSQFSLIVLGFPSVSDQAKTIV